MAAEASPKDGLRCHHCTGPLSKDMETSGWNLPPLIRDSFSMIGSALGGSASEFYGFNRVMPFVHRWVKGPMWLHFLIGAPPVIVCSSVCAGLTGGCSASNRIMLPYHHIVSSHSPPSSTEDDKMHTSRASSSSTI